MKEEVTNSVAGIEGKEEPLNKKKMAKRKKKGDCPMKERYKKTRYAGQDWDGTGATYVVGKITKAKKAGKSSTPKRDKGKPSKESQDTKGNGNVKEYYVSPEGFVLFAEAGVLRSVMRNKNGRMVKVRIHKKAHKGAADVTTGGKKRTKSSIRKNILKMGGISKMKKKSRILKKTLKKGKSRRAVGAKKVSRINISKHLK